VCPPEEDLTTTAASDPFHGQVPVIRPAAITDVLQIHDLLDTYANMGNVLPRPFSELYRHLRDFFVIELDGKLVACGALEIFTENLGEVRSLVVAEEYKKHGLGRRLVARIVDEARQIGLRRVMALTYVPQFFHNMGFRTVAKETLPEKVWGICVKCYKFNHCDETAVLLELW
jgi:amino-acid N-acetyltransferase